MADSIQALLITPPFTQLNTPYPATAYLKGYLNTIDIRAAQADLGIEVLLAVFSKEGLTHLYNCIEAGEYALSASNQRMVALKQAYIASIDAVISFLQNKDSTLAYAISGREYLPEGNRFSSLDDLEWAFGNLGTQDKARHLATLYLEDLSDLIKETVDPFFGFSRYAERISMSSESFDELYDFLNDEPTFIDDILFDLLEHKIQETSPTLVGLSVPFPGNLYSALRCGQYLKQNHPTIKVAMGGGYTNTELRTVQDKRLFEFIDYITLDDGERPLELLLNSLQSEKPLLKRALHLQNDEVTYQNDSTTKDVPYSEIGTPDYTGLALDNYLSVIELANPMHRLWSDGRWNKLTMAHGCYWKQCTFCDISLDYIKNYEPVTAEILCDRVENLIAQTGQTGFHFVDEAAPPALMREFAIEVLKRQLKITWWTNIRFEKRFTPDLCVLLKASGCIAVSGGLEVASDRLLEKIKKGVTVAQVAQVTDNFTAAGVMVHAYLMYGFPTQTAQETIDSLEMVRQMFELGIIQSGFWHQFAMTAHSPVGMNPGLFDVVSTTNSNPKFAHNDLQHEDPTGTDHQLFSNGLKTSLYNFMHGVGFDLDLQDWFDHPTPKTTIQPFHIEMALQANEGNKISKNTKLIWLHSIPLISRTVKKKKGKSERIKFQFHSKSKSFEISMSILYGKWLGDIFHLLLPTNEKAMTMTTLKESFEAYDLGSFESFLKSHEWKELCQNGLLNL